LLGRKRRKIRIPTFDFAVERKFARVNFAFSLKSAREESHQRVTATVEKDRKK
jgi:hypothetical protein